MAYIDFINKLTYALQQLQQQKQGQDMQEMVKNSEIEIKTKGDTADLKIKGMPKSLLKQNDISQMYNMEPPKKYEDLGLAEQAKVDAQIEMQEQVSEKPKGGIMGFLQAIPLGGFKFDRRAGWGNVINALLAGSVGQEAINERYKQEQLNYQKMKNQLSMQLLNEKISTEEYNNKMKEQELRLKALEQTQKTLYQPIDTEQWAESIFGNKELANDFKGLVTMLGYGEEKDGRHYVNPMQINQLEENIKNIFPTGMLGWMEMRLRNKLAEAQGEERKRIEAQLSTIRDMQLNPNVREQSEVAREKYEQQRDLQKMREDMRIKYAYLADELTKKRMLFNAELKKQQNEKEKEISYTKQYDYYFNKWRDINKDISNMQKVGITEENMADYESLVGLKNQLWEEMKKIEPYLQVKEKGKESKIEKSTAETDNIKKAFMNFFNSGKELNEQNIKNFILNYAKYRKISPEEVLKVYNQLRRELSGG